MTNPEIYSLAKDAALLVVTPALSVAFTFVAFKAKMEARAEANEEVADKLRKDLDKFMEDFRTFITTVQITTGEHSAALKVVTHSLESIVGKLENNDNRLNGQAQHIAVLEERIKREINA